MNISMDDIDLFVLHQANLRILQSIGKRLKVPEEKIPPMFRNTETCLPPVFLYCWMNSMQQES